MSGAWVFCRLKGRPVAWGFMSSRPSPTIQGTRRVSAARDTFRVGAGIS